MSPPDTKKSDILLKKDIKIYDDDIICENEHVLDQKFDPKNIVRIVQKV